MLSTTLLVFSSLAIGAQAIELTFELPDNERECFYDDIKANVESVIEFQVVTGGKYDVDMTLEDEAGNVLYQGIKKQYGTHSWKIEKDGTFKACFSNEFSTFSHKIVYMDWQRSDRVDSDVYKASTITPLTQLETSAVTIGDRLRVIDDYQTHHRLREATGRKRAEDLNERVTWWSLGQTAVILLIGVSQVLLLRSFFSEKKTVY